MKTWSEILFLESMRILAQSLVGRCTGPDSSPFPPLYYAFGRVAWQDLPLWLGWGWPTPPLGFELIPGPCLGQWDASENDTELETTCTLRHGLSHFHHHHEKGKPGPALWSRREMSTRDWNPHAPAKANLTSHQPGTPQRFKQAHSR